MINGFFDCLSGMIEVDGVIYQKNQRALLNHRSIIHLCDADGHVFSLKIHHCRNAIPRMEDH